MTDEPDDELEPIDPDEIAAAGRAVRRHLEEHGISLACSLCGGEKIATLGDVAIHVISGRKNPEGPNTGHGSIHAVTLSCDRCGHLEFFDYYVLEPDQSG